MRGFVLLLLFVSSVATAQISIQKLGEAATPQNGGTSVAISPRNNKNIVVYVNAKVVYSTDLGATWTDASLTLPSDILETPLVTSDSKGNFIIFYTSANQLTCQHSTDDGKTWSEPVVIAPAPGKIQYNPGVGVHAKKEELMVTWTEADALRDNAEGCKSNIRMSTSGSTGKKWSAPVLVNQNPGNCADEDFTVRGSAPMMAFDGKTFITWASQGAMFYDRSYDGNMWISTDLAIKEQAGGWTLTIPGFGKIANTPSFVGDNSPSRMRGTLFLAYSDLKAGENDSDIWLTRSVSRGDNWTVAVRINQDKPGREQFSPKMAIDQANGSIYIVYYDRRDYADNRTDVYLAWSTDGGNQFKEKKLTEQPFIADLNADHYATTYIGIAAQKGVIVPVWTAINNGKQEIYTAVIEPTDLK
jgi:hypothetical protein